MCLRIKFYFSMHVVLMDIFKPQRQEDTEEHKEIIILFKSLNT